MKIAIGVMIIGLFAAMGLFLITMSYAQAPLPPKPAATVLTPALQSSLQAILLRQAQLQIRIMDTQSQISQLQDQYRQVLSEWQKAEGDALKEAGADPATNIIQLDGTGKLIVVEKPTPNTSKSDTNKLPPAGEKK